MQPHAYRIGAVLAAGLALAAGFRPTLAAEPSGNRIMVVVTPGSKYRIALGAAGGGAIAGGIQSENATKRSEELNSKAQELGVLPVGPVIAARLKEDLRAKGYQIVREKRAVPEAAGEADEEAGAQAQPEEVDLLLTVVLVSPGFYALNAAADYRPNLRALVKIRDIKSRAVLHSARVVYGQTYLPGGTTVIPVAAKYSYASYDLLLSRAGEAFEGLAKGAEPVAAAIAERIPPAAKLRR